LSDPNPDFMREAIRLGLEGMRAGFGGPFGCVIVRDGAILARGFNQVLQLKDPTAHAEMVAIRMACRAVDSYQLTGCDLYTSCEPCPMCLGAIYWSRPARVFYANTRDDAAAIDFDDEFIYEQLDRPIAERSIPMVQMLRDEAQPAFAEWKAKHDRQFY
jgi:tRNA(Arg) A34 adenosine deaminase TadA